MQYEIKYKPAFAAIVVTPTPGQTITSEAGAMASMDAGLAMQTQFFGGFFSALFRSWFGGEGLVCQFSGAGRLWLQSRQLFHLVNFLNPFRPVKSSNYSCTY